MKHSYNFIDWTGKEIGPFFIIKETEEKSKSGKILWEVKCKKCGRKDKKTIHKWASNCKSCDFCRENKKEKSVRWKGIGDLPHTHFNRIRHNARQRKLEFKITLQYLWNLYVNQNKKCNLSGLSINFGSSMKKLVDGTASLDRIDNHKGYIEGNVQWIHKDINIMKNTLNESNFISYCSKISSHKINLKNDKLKILVTGGAGYIGNVLTPHLLNNGYKVTVFDNLIHRQHNIITNVGHENFKFVYGDVRNRNLYKDQIKSNDIIINLSAYVGAPLCSRFPLEANEVNFESACFLSEMTSKNQKIIFPCTNSGYGSGQHINGKAIFCTEESPLSPISIYGSTKVKAEAVLMSKGNCVSLRLATVMGVSPKMRMDLLVNDFTYRAWNDGFIVLFESHFLRNFIHIKDVAQTFLQSIQKDDMINNVYNVGNTSANVNKMELCLKIKKYLPKFYITESPINEDPDKRNYIVSNQKLEKLGWRPRFSLDDSIQEILKVCPIIKHSNYSFSDI